MDKVNNIIEYTNMRLVNWYVNAKRDYGVVGEGQASVDGDWFVVDYKENGIQKKWQMNFYPDDAKITPLDFFFNIWAEEAN